MPRDAARDVFSSPWTLWTLWILNATMPATCAGASDHATLLSKESLWEKIVKGAGTFD